LTLEVAGLGLVSESGLSSVWKNLKRPKMSLLLSAMIFGIWIFALDLGIYLFTLVLPFPRLENIVKASTETIRISFVSSI